jgi:hypothetical protein
MSAPASDPPAQPPTGNEKTDAPVPAAATTDAGEVKTEDVEMKKEEETPVDRFEDVPEHVLKVCLRCRECLRMVS